MDQLEQKITVYFLFYEWCFKFKLLLPMNQFLQDILLSLTKKQDLSKSSKIKLEQSRLSKIKQI
jgi:hypothetical protein